jgi:hypothetical protein
VPIQKWPICPISVLCEKFYPRNINHMPAVKFFARLDLDPICLFLNGHYVIKNRLDSCGMTDNTVTCSIFPSRVVCTLTGEISGALL